MSPAREGVASPRYGSTPARARLRPLPRRRTPFALPARQDRSRATRARLIGAVEIVIRERGLAVATVRAIAAQAGVAVGTLYRRFRNKRVLIEEVRALYLEQREQRVVQTLRPDRRDGSSERQRIARFVNSAFLEMARDRPLLEAFAADSYPGVAVFEALRARAVRRAPDDVLDLLLLALRGCVPPASGSFLERPSRHAWTEAWCRLAARALAL